MNLLFQLLRRCLNGGMGYEALNHIGNEGRNIIRILNDNEMSIAPNVGAIMGFNET